MSLAPIFSAFLIAAAAAETPSDVDRLRGLMALAKGHGGVMYELARALARAGQAEEAVLWLEAALDQGLDLDLGDPAFKPLQGREDFKDQLARAQARGPVARSRVAFRIPDPELVPEGIAWDARTGHFFVGSLHKKKILRVEADGRSQDFAASGQDGLEDVLGLKVDAEGRTLWACTAASGGAGPRAGRSGLLRYDIDSGRLLRALWLENENGKHLLNDIALGRDGEAFVTDSDAHTVWRVPKDADRLEVLIGPGTVHYPNGIALSADEERLYVADFKAGLSIVDLATRAVRSLPHPEEVSTAGIDGLYRDGADLVAVQNGAGRERIVRYRLDPAGEAAVALEVLESRNPLFRSPTTGVVAGGDFVYLANPNLEALDERGDLRPDAHLEELVVLRLPLR